MKGRIGKGGINWSECKLAMDAAAQRRNGEVPPPRTEFTGEHEELARKVCFKGPPSRFRTPCLSGFPVGLSGHRAWYKDVARGRMGGVADVRERVMRV